MKRSMIAWLSGTSLVALAALGLGIAALVLTLDDDGLVVSGVVPGSPADEAGLEVGDRLLALDGTDLESAADAAEAVSTIEPGSSAELRYERDGEPRSMQIEPRALSVFDAAPAERQFDRPLDDLRERFAPRLEGLLPGFDAELNIQVVVGQLASIDATTIRIEAARSAQQFEIDDQTRLLPDADAFRPGDSVIVIASDGVARVVWLVSDANPGAASRA
jgi:membrane-associated protease RseP (regulator of RpoE activity)